MTDVGSKLDEMFKAIIQEQLDRFELEYALVRKHLDEIAKYLALRPGLEYFPCDITLRIDCSELTKLDFARMGLLALRDVVVEKYRKKHKFTHFLKYLEHAGIKLGDIELASVILIELPSHYCAAARRVLDYIRFYAEKYEYLLLVYSCRELRKCFGYDTVRIPDLDWFVSVTDAIADHVSRLIMKILVSKGLKPELAKDDELLGKVYTIARDHAVRIALAKIPEIIRETLYKEADEIVKQQWRAILSSEKEEFELEESSEEKESKKRQSQD